MPSSSSEIDDQGARRATMSMMDMADERERYAIELIPGFAYLL